MGLLGSLTRASKWLVSTMVRLWCCISSATFLGDKRVPRMASLGFSGSSFRLEAKGDWHVGLQSWYHLPAPACW